MSRRTFVERGIGRLLRAEAYAMGAEAGAAHDGILQRLDPRVKVASCGILLVAVATSRNLIAIASILLAITALAWLSSLSIRAMAGYVWLPMLLFLTVMAAPALVTTPGTAFVVVVPGLTVTAQGLRAATMLLLRVEAAATLSYVLIVSTTWPRVLAALGRLRVPAPVIVLLSMTTRYLFLFIGIAHDMLLSRRSRAVGTLSRAQERSLAGAMMGSLMLRSVQLSHDVHDAMRARGFRGSFETLDHFHAGAIDGVALVSVMLIATVTIWSGL